MANAPLRLWTSGTAPQDDGLTAYGSPPITTVSPGGSVERQQRRLSRRVEILAYPARYAGATGSTDATSAEGWASAGTSGAQFAPLEPFSAAERRENSRAKVLRRRRTGLGTNSPASATITADRWLAADVRLPSEHSTEARRLAHVCFGVRLRRCW